MLSGLTASFTVTIFLFTLIIYRKRYVVLNFREFKLEITFLAWCFICCFETDNPSKSLITYCEILILIMLGLISTNKFIVDKFSTNYVTISLVAGISCAIIIFFVEYFSQGLFFSYFHSKFQTGSSNLFMLNSLDRGCALLSLSSWLLIGLLLRQDKTKSAAGFYILILYVLYLSDSLASFLGFILSGIFVLFIKVARYKFLKLCTIGIITGSVLLPFIITKIDPQNISQKFNYALPDSAKHRLFIWHFVGNKSLLKPLSGWGFGGSRQYQVAQEEMVSFQKYIWSPLPLHPHNNILQILFELGGVGLALYSTLR